MIELLPNPPGIQFYNKCSYDEAFLYVITLYHKGYSDWRFPTIREWSNHEVIPYSAWTDRRENEQLLRFRNNHSFLDTYYIFPVRGNDDTSI